MSKIVNDKGARHMLDVCPAQRGISPLVKVKWYDG